MNWGEGCFELGGTLDCIELGGKDVLNWGEGKVVAHR